MDEKTTHYKNSILLKSVELVGKKKDSLLLKYENTKDEEHPISINRTSNERVVNQKIIRNGETIYRVLYTLIETEEQFKNKIKKYKNAISLENCIFFIDVDFSDVEFQKPGLFMHSIFTKNVIFCKPRHTFLNPVKTKKFLEKMHFYNAKFLGHADFNYCEFQKEADFVDVTFKKSVGFRECIFNEVSFERYISGCFCEEASFSESNFIGFANFQKMVNYKKIDFSSSIFKQEIDFSYAKFFGEVNFSNTTVETYLSLLCSEVRSQINFNFSNINRLRLEPNILSKMSMYRTKTNDLIYEKNIFTKENVENKETALVLKNDALSKHDRISALNFHKLEYEKYWDEIINNLKDNLVDFVIIGIEKLFSNFGTNWLKAVTWLIGLSFLFSILIFLTESNCLLSFWELLLSTINPFYKPEGLHLSILSKYLVVIHKVVYFILLYEIIKSFRKFSIKL